MLVSAHCIGRVLSSGSTIAVAAAAVTRLGRGGRGQHCTWSVHQPSQPGSVSVSGIMNIYIKFKYLSLSHNIIITTQ